MRVAFLTYGGMDASGTSRWMQSMAAGLPAGEFEVDYFYCHPARILGSPYQPSPLDEARLSWMRARPVNLVEYNLKALDARRITRNWIGTNFWKVFDPSKYHLVQVAKAGSTQYPYFLLEAPVVEFLSLGNGVDSAPNVVWSIHCSEWQRQSWIKIGGRADRSSVISNPVFTPAANDNFRAELKIPASAMVAGFHQRVDEFIVSNLPLEAFARTWKPDRHFVLMGGGAGYRQQAQKLGLKNVHFLPHSGDMATVSRFLNTLDIYAHGRADGETFGTVLAEAMAHGKPCLTHYVEGSNNAQAQTIGPGGICAQNLAEYASALDRLADSSELRARYAAQGLAFAKQSYLEEAAVNKVASLYRNLVGKKSIQPVVSVSADNFNAALEQNGKQNSSTVAVHGNGNSRGGKFGIFRRVIAGLPRFRLAFRNALQKLYWSLIKVLMRRKLAKHPFFLNG